MAQMHMANAFDPESVPAVPARTAELLTRREAVLSASYRLFYREPVEVVRAEGACAEASTVSISSSLSRTSTSSLIGATSPEIARS